MIACRWVTNMKAAFYETLESFDGFSVGDELTIRPDLHKGADFRYYVLYDMSALAGQTVRILEIVDSMTVHLETEPEDIGQYYWSPDMFLKSNAPQYEDFELDIDELLA